MKPELQKIFTKLSESKVKQEIEKIDLSTAKSLASADKKVERDLKEGAKAERMFNKLGQEKVALAKKFEQFANDYKNGIAMSAPLYNEMKEFARKAKELGFDARNTNEYKSAEMTAGAYEEYAKELKKLSTEASSIAKLLR